MAATFWLPAHVHACLSGTHVVLLDLRRDRYLAIDAAESCSLALVVAGWPTLGSARAVENECVDSGEARALASLVASELAQEGLLTADPLLGRSAAVQSIRPATASLLTIPGTYFPAIQPRHVAAFVRALAVSLLELKILPIGSVVKRFQSRRAALTRHATLAAPQNDVVRLQGMVSVFFRLRPFFFRSHDACMLRSLALAHFLFQFGFTCRWVFGVQDAPFCAHCWLAYESFLVNDTLERVSGYTPILEV